MLQYHYHYHPLEVVSRYRDPQLQVGKNVMYFYSLFQNIANFSNLLHILFFLQTVYF